MEVRGAFFLSCLGHPRPVPKLGVFTTCWRRQCGSLPAGKADVPEGKDAGDIPVPFSRLEIKVFLFFS